MLRMLSCLLLIVLTLGSFARADTQFEVSAGFFDRVVENTFTPIRIHIQHEGPALAGELVLFQTVNTPWRGVFTETLSQPFKLGQRANKAFTVYFPLNSTIYPLEVQLKSQSGQIIAQQTLELHDAGERLIVALSETGFPSKLPSGETILSLQSDQLPDHIVGFESIRRIYLGRLNLASLDRAQQQALLQWIMLGGDLVVLGGNNWYVQDTPLLHPWLPLNPVGVEDVTYANGGMMPTVLGTLHGSVIFSSIENQPLILRRSLGQGYVWFTTINPLTHPPSSAFWKALKQEPYQDEIPFSQLAENMFLQQPLTFPSRLFVTMMLMAFIGGTGLFSWLGMHRSWASIALFGWVLASVVGVTTLLTQPQFSKSLTVTEYGLETVFPDGTAHLQTWLGLYAQRKEAAQMTFPTNTRVRQQLPDNRGDHLYDLDYLIDTGTHVSFSTQPQQIRALLGGEPMSPSLLWRSTPDGLIEVESTLELEQAWLLHGGKLYELGQLHPDQPRHFRLDSLTELSIDSLPQPVTALWSWGATRHQTGSLIGGWHHQGQIVLHMPALKSTYHLIIAEGTL